MTTGSWTPWTRRIGLTAAAAVAAVTLAGPGTAEAATTATTTATATAAAAEDVSYATWQQDCQAVMDQALPFLKQRIAAASTGEKPAIVFDIDNTTLETDFGFSYPSPANAPVLKVAQYAQDHGVALFFVTARPDIIKPLTQYNLTTVGYKVTGLYVRNFIDLFKNVADYKTAQRVDIESKGYTIIANIGNTATDLSGGHAEKTYKLPDYDGQLS
ncbi:HAD family acid phosphatase [Streptomyces turgidiscabies]|uniref:HAD phosphatase, family IIIB n=1 Tax=Streptomyces turgidiscabies (strain Car8) TaxID=698760 RepID=L7ERK9_STRT8|nr:MULTISPECIES: HAD family acid phosphatase [Streptomyces]ELP61534.1 HAD phosphatase, family IIIB [Streptomyces turgidiscabies Car8]MDX3492790.1 HAD family acid phosphatase [Streptomyces turgidiscabies]GAQ75767.1 HAD superfamily, subfamily IIIB (Acid [Streptomyces turgidiscabies]